MLVEVYVCSICVMVGDYVVEVDDIQEGIFVCLWKLWWCVMYKYMKWVIEYL